MNMAQHQVTITDSKNIIKPRIDCENPDDYSVPRELFVKQLINSPLEFGSLEISRAMDANDNPVHRLDPSDPRHSGWIEHCSIDLAMHAHLGLLICAYAEGSTSAELRHHLDETLHRLKEDRQLLLDRLAKRHEMHVIPTPEIGLFIVAPQATRQQIPAEWNSDDAWICTGNQIKNLPQHMISAMMRFAELDGEPTYGDWPRVMAVIQRMDYTSALQWLLIYEEI